MSGKAPFFPIDTFWKVLFSPFLWEKQELHRNTEDTFNRNTLWKMSNLMWHLEEGWEEVCNFLHDILGCKMSLLKLPFLRQNSFQSPKVQKRERDGLNKFFCAHLNPFVAIKVSTFCKKMTPFGLLQGIFPLSLGEKGAFFVLHHHLFWSVLLLSPLSSFPPSPLYHLLSGGANNIEFHHFLSLSLYSHL